MSRLSTVVKTVLPAVLLLVASAAMPDAARAQETVFRGFADATYRVSSEGDGANTFSVGQYDFFVTSRLSEKWRFLSEIVFEFVDDDFVSDIERIVIEYHHSQQFRVAAGRVHTPVGFWFTQYHHGALLEPVIERPLAFRFEDEGGILTSHQVGVKLMGDDIGPLNLGYDVLIANGVTSTPAEDLDQAKAMAFRLRSRIDYATQVGVGLALDRIEAGTTVVTSEEDDGAFGAATELERDVDQQIWSAFLVHLGPRLEFQAEALRIRHEDDLGSTTTDSFYAYAGYRSGRWVPYALFDWVDIGTEDPYFRTGDHHHFALGGRLDASGTVVLKAEGRREFGHVGGDFNTLTFQVAVGF